MCRGVNKHSPYDAAGMLFKKEKFIMIKHIAAFQLAGYSAWNGEDAGSNPACYTNCLNLDLLDLMIMMIYKVMIYKNEFFIPSKIS